jgi:hypothetical protein
MNLLVLGARPALIIQDPRLFRALCCEDVSIGLYDPQARSPHSHSESVWHHVVPVVSVV